MRATKKYVTNYFIYPDMPLPQNLYAPNTEYIRPVTDPSKIYVRVVKITRTHRGT